MKGKKILIKTLGFFQVLFRYGYRLERTERITDPLKRIELFKASLFLIIKSMKNQIQF